MNQFKDEQGRTWLCTPNMAKHLGITPGALACYKYDGTLKRGTHWVQQTTGHRRVFYNRDVVRDWWNKSNPSTSDQKTKTAAHPKSQTFSVYLTDDLHERLVSIQQDTSLTIKKEIDGMLMEVTDVKPKLGTVVNMLIAKAINDHFESRAA
jgi:hypothetical protein